MNNPLSPTGEFPAFNPTARTVLDVRNAVSLAPIGPRWRRRDWQLHAQLREVGDIALRDAPTAPRPEPDNDHESIILESNVIENRLTTGAHVVRQRRVCDFETLPELAIAPEPFVPVVSTARDDAAEALRAMDRKPHSRRGVRLPRPATLKPPRTASKGALAVAFIIAAIVIGMLLVTVAKAGERDWAHADILPPEMREADSFVYEEIAPPEAVKVVWLIRREGYVCDTVSSMKYMVGKYDHERNYSVICNHRRYAFLLFPEKGGKWSVRVIQ